MRFAVLRADDQCNAFMISEVISAAAEENTEAPAELKEADEPEETAEPEGTEKPEETAEPVN